MASAATATAEGSSGVSTGVTVTGPDGRFHHLGLLFNGRLLPFSMTIFEAIRQYGTMPRLAIPTPAGGSDGAGEGSSTAVAAGAEGEGGAQPPPRPTLQSSIGQRLWADVYSISYQPLREEDRARVMASEGGEGTAPPSSSLAADGVPAAAAYAAGGKGWSLKVLPHEREPLLALLAAEPPALATEGGSAAPLLQLLWTLTKLDAHGAALYERAGMGAASGAPPPAAHVSAFVNRKLNAKLQRQLADPLALCARALPSWCASLASGCPELFAFEARRLLLQSTAFGLSRALQRLQQHSQEGAAAPNDASASERGAELRLGRLPRQKVRISRSRVVDSALKVIDLYAAQKASLEVEYFGEAGTGLGPTLEFYTLVSRELRRSELRLWVDESASAASAKEVSDMDKIKTGDEEASYVYAACGLYPRPIAQGADGSGVPARTLQLFGFMGKFVAKAMLDNRLVDLPFCQTFYKQLLGEPLSIADLAEVNPSLASQLQKLQRLAHQRTALLRGGAKPSDASVKALKLDGVEVGDLGLDLTLPGAPEIELCPDGGARDVTLDNVGEYVQRVLDVYLVEAVLAQIKAFREGFSAVFPIEHLSAFAPSELDCVLNGSKEAWEVSTIVEYLKFDHGYTRASKAIGFLLEILCEMSPGEVATFLKFVTGSPRLPVGGLARLNPRLTIVQKRPEDGISPDAYLPSVMTCANYVKLPDYSSKVVMKQRLFTAINEGQGAFYLS
jgi:E3 ubiquitin-protein ligase TRIP12